MHVLMRLLASASAALFAYMLGKALGLPDWRDWDIGDRTDLAVTAFFTVWWAISAVRNPTPHDGGQ